MGKEISKALPKGVGRPKGSRNKITILKLMTEEAVRSKNTDRMLEVCDQIIEAALEGDRDCRKLVWSSIMSKSGVDANQHQGQIPEIVIRSDKPPEVHIGRPEKVEASAETDEDDRIIDADIVEDKKDGQQAVK